MQIYNHPSQLDQLPESQLKNHLKLRLDQLIETEDDLLPNIVVVEATDNIIGPAYAFIGNRGLLSDLFEEFTLGEKGFVRPFEWASHWSDLGLYEVLLLVNNEDGYWIFIPESVVEANPGLKWVLTDESQGGLSEPQPL